MDSGKGLESVESITLDELRHYVDRGNRLRSEAIASALHAAGRAIRQAFRTPDAVAHERRERARRIRRTWTGGGLSGDGLPGGAR